EAARAGAAAGQGEEALVQAVEEHLRLSDRRDLRDADTLAVAERSLAARGPPAAAEGGGGDDACGEPAAVLEADQRGEDRDAADVVLRRVDRIDDPAPLARAAGAELFSHDPVVRPLGGEPL